MTPDVAEALKIVAARKTALARARRGRVRRSHGRPGHRGAEGRPPARDRDARRDGRRDRRRGRGAARRACGASRRGALAAPRHLRSGRPRAATSSISRRRRRSWRRGPEPPSPSTATARSPRASARPTSSRRAASRVDLEPERAGRILDEVGLVFLFAPAFHPAMKELGTVRRELGIRTIFNALGPLANPAGATRQLIGVGTSGARTVCSPTRSPRSAPSGRSSFTPRTASTSWCRASAPPGSRSRRLDAPLAARRGSPCRQRPVGHRGARPAATRRRTRRCSRVCSTGRRDPAARRSS